MTAAGCVGVLLPRLAHRGMFLDGVTYASIARNLAQGRGHFWAPHYTATIYPAFYEHPPLAFWLQSLWFRGLGDHWFVERLYSAAAAVLIAGFTVVTWRAIQDLPDAHDRDWLPVALWIAVPVVSWTIVGNLLETTVSVFVTAAVAVLTVRTPGSIRSAIGTGVLSALCILAATLSKGPVGLFPLAAPPILAALPGVRWRSMWYSAAAQWTIIAVCGGLLVAIPESREGLLRYLHEQVMPALAGRREVSGGSLTIIVALLLGVWLPMAIVCVMFLLAARRWTTPPSRDRAVGAAFIALGLCGTLPILISPKQTGHYLMPAVPFYAIGAASFIAATVSELLHRLGDGGRATRSIRILAGILTVVAIIAARLPAFERDTARLADLDRLARVAPRGATAGICSSTNGDWALHAWFQRRFEMSLDATHPLSHEWFLRTADDAGCGPPTCRAASEAGADLVLLRCDR